MAADRKQDELSDAVTLLNLIILARIEIDERHLDLAAVSAVDEAGGIGTGDAVSSGQAATRKNESTETVGHGNGDAGAHERAATTGGEKDILHRDQVAPGITQMGVFGENRVGMKSRN